MKVDADCDTKKDSMEDSMEENNCQDIFLC